jgi:hypothetical protein
MYRERLTITLEAELVAAADSLVDRSLIRNRSHAIEHLLKEGLGLHQLTQAFLFVEDSWTQELLEQFTKLCVAQGITTIFLCLPTAQASLAADLQGIIHQVADILVEVVALDFGSGGSLILKKHVLVHPFILVWLRAELTLPTSLVPVFVFHRQNHTTLTQLVHGTPEHYHTSFISIAQPDIISYIPAGIVSVEQTVFPELLKVGKVMTYATYQS